MPNPRKRDYPRKWDSLDIEGAADALLEGFAQEFYGVAWADLPDRDAKRIAGAFARHMIALGKACVPIPYELTELGRAVANGTASHG